MTEKELYINASKKIQKCLEELKNTQPFIYMNLENITKIITSIPQNIISKNTIGPLSHVAIEESIELVSEFLRSINPEYEKIFIKYYEDGKITMDLNKDSSHYFEYNEDIVITNINIQKRENLKDALLLVHEYFHELNVNLLDYRLNLTDSISITAELLFLKFLKDKKISEYDLDLLLSNRKTFFKDNVHTLNLLLPIFLSVKETGICNDEIYNAYLIKYITKETYFEFIENKIIKPDCKEIIKVITTYRHVIGSMCASKFMGEGKTERDLYEANEYLKENNAAEFKKVMEHYLFEEDTVDYVEKELNKYHPKKYTKTKNTN